MTEQGSLSRSPDDWVYTEESVHPDDPILVAAERDSYAASLRAERDRAYEALAALQRDVERECAKSRPSKQRLREALGRSDLARGLS